MFHVNVGKDADAVRADPPAEAKEGFGDAVQNALIGQPGTDQNVDADEVGPRGGGDGHGPEAVVAEEVDAEGSGKEFAGFACQGGEAGDGGWSGGGSGEGGVAKIFDDDGVGTAFLQGEEVAPHGLANRFKFASKARGAGEGGQMDDAQKASPGQDAGDKIFGRRHGQILWESPLANSPF